METKKTNSYRFYTGKGPTKNDAGKPVEIVFPKRRTLEDDPAYYEPDTALVEAVNLGILMNQPILLTGDPGTGKTQLAYHVAYELGLGKPLKFETRSTSLSRDLFYYFNSMGLFQAKDNAKASKRAADYITYNALGLAILRSKVLTEKMLEKIIPSTFEKGSQPTRSVVLIDEIDKAPRDFPNDILNQIEKLYFRIPELENELVEADPINAPITIITSNSEKNLPNAFLRRCIFHHIKFPSTGMLQRIAANRLKELRDTNDPEANQKFLSEGIDLFTKLSSKNNSIKKKPATAEMIVWLHALRRMSSKPNNPCEDGDKVFDTLGAVVKEHDDWAVAEHIVEEWLNSKGYVFTPRKNGTE